MNYPYNPSQQFVSIDSFKPKDNSIFWIAIAVIIGHILLTFSTLYISTTPLKKPTPQKLVVATVQLNPKTEILNPLSQPLASQQKKIEIARPSIQPTPPKPVQEKEEIPKNIVKEEEVKPEKLEKAPENIPEKKIEQAEKNPPQVEVKKDTAKPKEIKKTEEKAVEKEKPKSKIESKKVMPKAKATETPKPADKKSSEQAKKVINPAPVKKNTAEPKKPKVEEKKGPTAEEIAALEAEKVRQKEIALAKAKEQELLSKAKESLAKIGASRDKIGANKVASLSDTTIPQQLENLKIDALPVGSGTPGELNAKEVSYRDEVAYRLKTALKLPDYGSVKIKLILNRSGRVDSVQIISSESEKNKQYIEKNVLSLIFPSFGNRFGELAQYSFFVTLNNDH